MAKVDYPSVERVHLPVDFDGPICAKCIHVLIPDGVDDLPVNGHNWRCAGHARAVITPASTNPVTGKFHEIMYASYHLCKDKNGRGDCDKFVESKP